MDTALTAMAAVFQVGGFTENASPEHGILLRDNGKNMAEVIRVNFKEALEGSPDVVLHPYDIVYVPKSGIGKLNQVVEQYVRRMSPSASQRGSPTSSGAPSSVSKFVAKSVLVTGAYGFVGRHAARRLAGEGHRVTGIGHGGWTQGEARRGALRVARHGRES